MTSYDADEPAPEVEVAIHHELNGAWSELPPIVVGPIAARTSPKVHVSFVTATGAGRIDVYVDDDAYCFREDAIAVGTTVFIGAGERVAVVDTATRAVREHRLDCYFGYLHPLSDGALVASGCSLWRLALDGTVCWRCEDLGIDGVVVSRVEDGVVHGDAELDPPGGWVPFRVDLETGRRLE